MKILYFLLYISPLFLFSQNNILVEYEYFQNGGTEVIQESHFLLANEKESYYIMPSHKFYKNYEELYGDNDYTSHPTRKSIYKKSDENTLFSYDYLVRSKSPEEKFVKDSVSMYYKLSKGEERILGYACNLAEVNFRGRNYKVWYTKEIPFSDGPWKFFGLPGLILKAEDNFGMFKFNATRIVQNSKFIIPKKIEQSFKDLSNAISYREFIKLEDSVFIEFRNKVIASLPKGTIIRNTPQVRSNFIETEFEWDSKKP